MAVTATCRGVTMPSGHHAVDTLGDFSTSTDAHQLELMPATPRSETSGLGLGEMGGSTRSLAALSPRQRDRE